MLAIFAILVILVQFGKSTLLGNVEDPVEFFDISKSDHPEEVLSAFSEFKQRFNRTYKDKREHAHRLNVFAIKHNMVQQLNEASKKAGRNTVFGINKFSDRTTQEMSSIYSNLKPANISDLPVYKPKLNASISNRHKRQTGKNPTNFDLRNAEVNGNPIIGPIKDQGQCGCCWGFSSTGVIETAFAIYNKQYVSLSEMEICDCATDGSHPGCVGGDPSMGIRYAHAYGQTDSYDYPYVNGEASKLGRCRMRRTERVLQRNQLNIYRFQNDGNPVGDIINYLNTYDVPVAAYFTVGKLFENYLSGIFEDTVNCTKPMMENGVMQMAYHSVPIIGYGTDVNPDTGRSVDYWILRNSWGEDWGDNGYVKVIRGVNWCGIENQPVSAVMQSGSSNYYNDYNNNNNDYY